MRNYLPLYRNLDRVALREALSVDDLFDRRGCLRADAIDFN
jgi:hypothetical protein